MVAHAIKVRSVDLDCTLVNVFMHLECWLEFNLSSTIFCISYIFCDIIVQNFDHLEFEPIFLVPIFNFLRFVFYIFHALVCTKIYGTSILRYDLLQKDRIVDIFNIKICKYTFILTTVSYLLIQNCNQKHVAHLLELRRVLVHILTFTRRPIWIEFLELSVWMYLK